MRFRYAISYESDTQPVETVRGELDARDGRQAAFRSGRMASRAWPKGRRFRSFVVVVEQLEAEAAEALDETDTAVSEDPAAGVAGEAADGVELERQTAFASLRPFRLDSARSEP